MANGPLSTPPGSPGETVEPNKLAVALAVRAAMQEHQNQVAQLSMISPEMVSTVAAEVSAG